MISPAKRINRVRSTNQQGWIENLSLTTATRKRVAATAFSFLALATCFTTPANAQRPQAELHSLNPPVAAAGQTFELSLSGNNLDNLTGLHFSDPKITAKPVMLPVTEYRKAPGQNGTKFTVTIPADINPGAVEVRSVGYFGLSTTRPLLITAKDTPIVKETGAANHTPETAPELPREAVAYGTTDASKRDYWKFTAKKGERLIITCRSEYLDSQADATLLLMNEEGRELERNRDFDGRDPLIDFTAPADGNYWVGIHDYLFNGGGNFNYVLNITAKPYIDFAIPPAIEPGKTARVKLFGRNLPGGSPGESMMRDGKPLETLEVDISAPNAVAPPASFSPRRPSHGMLPGFGYSKNGSNELRLGFASAPVVLENATDDGAQKITIPAEVAGRFDSRTDQDQYRFTTKKGGVYWVEVISDRFADGTDPYILVDRITKDKDGKEVFTKAKDADDTAGDGGKTFDTLSRDAAFTFTSAQDGDYQVTIANQFSSAGPEKIYRLAVREANPDFQLLAIPERPILAANQAATVAPLLRKNGTIAVKISVIRKDGFDQPITVAAEGLPPGVTCPPVVIGPSSTIGYLAFKSTPEAKPWHGSVSIVGKAKVGEAEVQHPALAGAIPLAVGNITTERQRARLDQQFALAVSDQHTEVVALELKEPAKPLVVEMDGTIDIPFKLVGEVPKIRKGNLAVTFLGLEGIGTKPPVVNVAEGKAEGVLKLPVKKVANVFTPTVGKHSFVLQGTGSVNYSHNPEAAAAAEEEKKFIAELTKKITADAARAKADAAAAKAAFDAATKNAAAASPEAKPALDKAATDAKAKYEAAQKLNTELTAKIATAKKEQTAADARAKALTTKAKEKATPFAVYSMPITLEIKPAPEKKEEPKK